MTDSALLIAFARAASKAQEIEYLLQESVIGAEVVADTRHRSFEKIAKEIDKLPLGPLKKNTSKRAYSQQIASFICQWATSPILL
jgi:hypothetical protein